MRVTSTTMFYTVRTSLQSSIAKVQQAQERLSSGKVLSRYSDGPADATAVLSIRSQESDWRSFATVADDALAWLNTQDQALQSSSSALRRVRDLVLTASNASMPADAREAVAREIEQLREHVRSNANTAYLGRSVFGGYGTTAVDPAGAWAGSPAAMADPMDPVQRRITPTATVTVNLDGRQVFGFAAGPGQDVFSVLTQLAADVRAGNTPVLSTSGLQSLDAATKRVVDGLASLGGLVNQVEAAKETGAAQLETLGLNRSNLEEADLAKTVMELQLAQAGYQATLGATARLSMPSLVDFLR